MRTLHAYLTREILGALLLTVAVFAFVLLLGNVLKEILSLLVNGQATFPLVLKAVMLLIPFVLAFALPMGMLTATLLVFGRFSADQELTAARASGISLLTLVTPVLLLGFLMTSVSAGVNLYVAPACREAYKTLIHRAGLERSPAFIQENRFIDDFPGYVLYVGRKAGTNLENVLILKLNEGRTESSFRAARAVVLGTTTNHMLRLMLHDAEEHDLVNLRVTHATQAPLQIQLGKSPDMARRKDLKGMSFPELRDKLVEMERLAGNPENPRTMTGEEMREQRRQLESLRKDLAQPVRAQIHQRLAFSFASIAFTLIGIPLGIRAHRRETSFGVALALVLVVIYYGFVVLAESLGGHPELAPHLIFWLPNFIFQAVGAVLLWRANYGV